MSSRVCALVALGALALAAVGFALIDSSDSWAGAPGACTAGGASTAGAAVLASVALVVGFLSTLRWIAKQRPRRARDRG